MIEELNYEIYIVSVDDQLYAMTIDSNYVYCKCIGGIDCVAWYTAYGRIHYDARVALG